MIIECKSYSYLSYCQNKIRTIFKLIDKDFTNSVINNTSVQIEVNQIYDSILLLINLNNYCIFNWVNVLIMISLLFSQRYSIEKLY
jgi:hypothetical protein